MTVLATNGQLGWLGAGCMAAAGAVWLFAGAGLLRVGARVVGRKAPLSYGRALAWHGAAGLGLLAAALPLMVVSALRPSENPIVASLLLAGGVGLAWLVLARGLRLRFLQAAKAWAVSLGFVPLPLLWVLPTHLRVQVVYPPPGHASQRIINRIDGGCQAYYNDNEEHLAPDELVAKLATAWRKKDKDGKIPPRARLHGPYNGCDLLRTRRALRRGETDPDEATGPVMFHDTTGNPILYFLYKTATGRFEGGRTYAGLAVGLPADIDAYVRGPDGLPFRRDFVLISPGANGKWDPPYDNGYTGSDDVNNFIPY